MKPRQMTLPVYLSQQANFENFFAFDRVVTLLRNALRQREPHLLFLLGPSGCGKSHLAFSACQEAEASGRPLHYLPGGELGASLEQACENLTGDSLLCIDDIDVALKKGCPEVSLFNIYNQQHLAGGQLLVSSELAPEQMKLALPDLTTRLQSGLLLRLSNLDDEHKQKALQMKAIERGLQLSDEAASYIMRRSGRELGQLLEVLETLDQASLMEQRRLTVPFIKQVLGW